MAEAELRELEANLEALEDELEAKTEAASEGREAALAGKVDELLAKAPTAKASAVAPAGQAASLGPRGLGRIAVCGLNGGRGAGELVLARLRDVAGLGGAEPQWMDLAEVGRLNFEEVDALLENCKAAVICPDTGDDTPEALESARQGLRAILAGTPAGLEKVLLLSHVGAQESKGGFNLGSFFNKDEGTTWADVEDELTSTARLRTSSRKLRTIIVRAGSPATTPAQGAGAEVRCSPLTADGGGGSSTSYATAAEALLQALLLAVDTGFAVVEEQAAEPEPQLWPELLLPFIGPEIWRAEVDDAKRSAFFVQGWAQEFFGDGKNAMRVGVKTPVQLQNTPSGVIFKFRPLGTGSEEPFDNLDEGGLEFIAEEPAAGPARLRVRRCAYGWKVSVKENSERALLDKFARDWTEVSTAKL